MEKDRFKQSSALDTYEKSYGGCKNACIEQSSALGTAMKINSDLEGLENYQSSAFDAYKLHNGGCFDAGAEQSSALDKHHRLLDHEYVPAQHIDDKTETIVLLHGFGGNHRIWKHQMDVLTRYYNVLSIDLPSHNEGNIKLSEMEVSLKAVCDRIIEVVDSYNIKHALFMGVSLGTVFVKCIEVYYPSYVDLGILVGTMAAVNTLLRSCVAIFSKVGDKLPFQTVYYIFSKIIMPRPDSKKSREIFRQCAKALNQKEFKLYMKLFNQAFKFNEKFKDTIHKENLYITGEDDICFKNGVFKEVLGTHSKLMVFEHCGHVCNIDKKEKFNYIIGRVLKHRLDAQRAL